MVKVQKTISLPVDLAQWVEDKKLNLSKIVQDALQAMKNKEAAGEVEE